VGAWLGIGFLTLLALLAVLGDRLWFVRSFDERVRDGGEIANQYALGPGRVAWFGTDALGSDIFAKCLYGARTTLIVGVPRPWSASVSAACSASSPATGGEPPTVSPEW
jgi:ABC-type dipeptide/oligopeptide/nickel transport system permease subunit